MLRDRNICGRLFGEVTVGRLVALSHPDDHPAAESRLLDLLVSPRLAAEARARFGEAGAPGAAAPDGAEAGRSHMRVLVVDDEEGVRVTLGHMLRAHGCEVITASSASGAMRVLPAGCDMAILDVKLPDANGFELIPHLREANPEIDIVIATAFGTLENAVEALRRGASDFLMKPFSLAEVARVVTRGAERARLIGERAGLVQRLERTVFELQLLSEVSRAASSTLDLRDLVAVFIEALPEMLRPGLARAWAAGPDGTLAWDVGRTGHGGGALAPLARELEAGMLALAGRRAAAAPPDAARAARAGSWIAVPFFAGEELGGLVILLSEDEERWTLDDAVLAYRVAETVSLAVERGRELVETQLRRMESVMGAIGEGVIMTDAHGVPNVVSPAARVFLGLPHQGDAAAIMERSAAGRNVLAHLRAALARREVATTREFLVEGDPPRQVSVQAGVVAGERGDSHGIVALLEDVTRRREFDLLQSEFVSAVSHELRTPLSCVRNYVDMVLDRRAGDLTTNQERFLATARRNIDRLTHMIDNLLSLSKSEEVHADASHQTVDIGAVARDLAASMQADAAARGVRFDLQLPVERLEVHGDRERLAQALGLVVRQAVKVCGRDSTIEILAGRVNRASLRPPPGEAEAIARHARWVRLSLRLVRADVSPVEARELFRRFKPSHNVEGRPLAASGLDLALARNLVEAHEGHLWAEVRGESALHFELIVPVEGPSPRQGELLDRVHRLLERSRREGLAMSVLIFRLGRPAAPPAGAHPAGAAAGVERDELADVDAALRVVAGVFRVSLRQEDRLFANRGAGELVLLLEHTDSRGMSVVCERVSTRLCALHTSEPGPLAGFIAELGWATFPQDGVTAQEIMTLARRRCVPVEARSNREPEGGPLPCLMPGS